MSEREGMNENNTGSRLPDAIRDSIRRRFAEMVADRKKAFASPEDDGVYEFFSGKLDGVIDILTYRPVALDPELGLELQKIATFDFLESQEYRE